MAFRARGLAFAVSWGLVKRTFIGSCAGRGEVYALCETGRCARSRSRSGACTRRGPALGEPRSRDF
eukprot:6104672-Prymnesium_polylepis.1